MPTGSWAQSGKPRKTAQIDLPNATVRHPRPCRHRAALVGTIVRVTSRAIHADHAGTDDRNEQVSAGVWQGYDMH